ncbi:hypothetical protein [Allorhizobium undicola]|uniref:hypothetical protein n=1 Tax=Allorhizobium undicola TaxID=78527 RepID=UPI0012B52E64|nr:hypothetical protein [Allorhizobium undicola]
MALLSAVLLEPFQAEYQSRIAQLQGSAAVVEQARTCVSETGTRLLDKGLNDPWWAARSAVGLATGFVEPTSLAQTVHPSCAGILAQVTDGAEQENL